MFGLKLTGGFADVIFTSVNEAVKAPRLAGQIIESVARIRRPGDEPLTKEQTSQASDSTNEQGAGARGEETSGFDLALAEAENINFSVKILHELINDDLRVKLQADGGEEEIKICVDGLKEVLDSLEGANKTHAAVQAIRLLKLAIRVSHPRLR